MLGAIIAAAIAVAGTLGAQYLAGRRESAREKRRSNDARIDDLRAVLDDAAQALTALCDAHRELEHAIKTRRKPDDVTQPHRTYLNLLTDARRQGARLAVRLGDFAPLHHVYDEAVAHAGDSRALFADLVGLARTYDDAVRKELLDDRGAALTDQQRFHLGAAGLAGPRLEHDRTYLSALERAVEHR